MNDLHSSSQAYKLGHRRNCHIMPEHTLMPEHRHVAKIEHTHDAKIEHTLTDPESRMHFNICQKHSI